MYYFKIIFNCINNSAVGDNSGDWGLTITKGVVATNRYITDDPGNISTQNTEYTTQFSTIAFLNVNDTVKMYVANWGADQETYLPNSSFFMGYLVSGFN